MGIQLYVRAAVRFVCLVVKITPLLLYAFTAIALYFLAKELARSRGTSLIAVFMYSTSKFYFSIVYPSYFIRAEFGILFIILFSLFVLKAIKIYAEDGKPQWGWIRNLLFAGLSLFALISCHDLSIAAYGLIMVAFLASMLAFDRRLFLKSSVPIFGSIGLGVLLSVPIIIKWWGFFAERFVPVLGAGIASEAVKENALAGLEIAGPIPYGYTVTLFAVIGLLLVLIRRSKAPGQYLLLGWLLSIDALSNLYKFDIYIYIHTYRAMQYMVVPLSIFVAIGISHTLGLIANWSLSFHRFDYAKFFTFVIVAPIVVMPAFTAATTIRDSPSAKPRMNEEMEDAMLWLKYNTLGDSIVFTSCQAPLVAYLYVGGLSERASIATPDVNTIPGPYYEYQVRSEATQVINLEDPKLTFRILDEYSKKHSHGYVFIDKKSIPWANSHGANISLERYNIYYMKVFENAEIIIYQVF